MLGKLGPFFALTCWNLGTRGPSRLDCTLNSSISMMKRECGGQKTFYKASAEHGLLIVTKFISYYRSLTQASYPSIYLPLDSVNSDFLLFMTGVRGAGHPER